MTYIVTDNCIKCKYTDCVEVCPVDCFYEGENMLVIHPDECIDCGVCEPECPAEAIKPDTESGLDKWLEINTKYASLWPNLSERRDPRHRASRTPRIARRSARLLRRFACRLGGCERLAARRRRLTSRLAGHSRAPTSLEPHP